MRARLSLLGALLIVAGLSAELCAQPGFGGGDRGGRRGGPGGGFRGGPGGGFGGPGGGAVELVSTDRAERAKRKGFLANLTRKPFDVRSLVCQPQIAVVVTFPSR